MAPPAPAAPTTEPSRPAVKKLTEGSDEETLRNYFRIKVDDARVSSKKKTANFFNPRQFLAEGIGQKPECPSSASTAQ